MTKLTANTDDRVILVERDDPDEEPLWVNEFSEEKAHDFCTKVLKRSAQNPKKPLVVYIDSHGGSTYALSAIIATLDSVPNRIITVCVGKAFSCGAMLLSHGDMRYVASTGKVMIHESSTLSGGNINDVKTDIQDAAENNDRWMEWLAKNCGLTFKQLKKQFTNKRRDVFFTAEEAVEFGIADKIGVPRIRKVIDYEVVL